MTKLRYCLRISDFVVARLEDLQRLALRGRQAAGLVGAPTRVLRGVVAEDLVRIVDAETRPCPLLVALAERLRGTAPDTILVDHVHELLLGLAVKEVPLEIVFADVVAAEPPEVLQVVG